MCAQAHVHTHPSFSIVPCTGAGSLEQCRKLCLWQLSVSGQQLRQVILPDRNSLLIKYFIIFPVHFQNWCLQNWNNCNLFFVNTEIFLFSYSPSMRKSRMHRAKSYPDNRQECSGESSSNISPFQPLTFPLTMGKYCVKVAHSHLMG